jgi:hypothetical protein
MSCAVRLRFFGSESLRSKVLFRKPMEIVLSYAGKLPQNLQG